MRWGARRLHPWSRMRDEEKRASRRNFLAGVAGATTGARAWHTQDVTHADAPAISAGMPKRKLGRTGEMVSMLGLGGFHIGQGSLSDDEAIRIIQRALDNGFTFLDNCWDYNKGKSEERMGKALQGGYRDRAFL